MYIDLITINSVVGGMIVEFRGHLDPWESARAWAGRDIPKYPPGKRSMNDLPSNEPETSRDV